MHVARRTLVSFCFGLRAAFFIWVLGERLVPDTYEYAHGLAAWSSPGCAFAGYLAGIEGVRVFALCGAMAIGWILGDLPASRILLVGLLPPGWYSVQASADAMGAAIAGWSELKWTRIPLVFLGHMQAALTCGFARVATRIGIPLSGALLLAGAISCLGQWHFQMRYFLTPLVLWSLKGRGFDLLRYRPAWSRKIVLRLP